MRAGATILQTEIAGAAGRRGKVRDIYDLGDKLLIVATDRISAFDVVMANGIPEKGKILTQLSLFWLGWLGGEVKNHLLSTEVRRYGEPFTRYAEQLERRSMLVKKTEVVPIECVVRGYLAGGGWKEYQEVQMVSGHQLGSGLSQCCKLGEPIFTPATKAQQGEHDENISFAQMADSIGLEAAGYVRDKSMEIYVKAAAYAGERGIILADTKFEWGYDGGEIILIDEVLTPDSSRFWPADKYEAGHDQESFDKQYVRNYLEGIHFNKRPPGPVLPEEVVLGTQRRYIEAYERLSGKKWETTD
ncbi:MAG: phosphoribosylaminoimidazole-succinocarboxamide synthase [Phycisphaerae bacterium SM23_30]|nr:MAG: phosphoribosylaminoimidazole-succinocarboxamide synthase [Phycisphaerae bacterium SM23_30]